MSGNSRDSAAARQQRTRNRLLAKRRGPGCLRDLLERVHNDLEAGRDPFPAREYVMLCVETLEELEAADSTTYEHPTAIWAATELSKAKLFALYAVALRRSVHATTPDDATHTAFTRLRGCLSATLARCMDVTISIRPALVLACVRGDVLNIYNAHLAECASQLRSHAQLRCEGQAGHKPQPRRLPQRPASSRLPTLKRVLAATAALASEALMLVGIIWEASGASTSTSAGNGITDPTDSTTNGSGTAAFHEGELLALQQQQLGVLDRCCRVALELLPLAAPCSPVSDTCVPDVESTFEKLDRQMLRDFVPRGLWLGTVRWRGGKVCRQARPPKGAMAAVTTPPGQPVLPARCSPPRCSACWRRTWFGCAPCWTAALTTGWRGAEVAAAEAVVVAEVEAKAAADTVLWSTCRCRTHSTRMCWAELR